jgi:uncharacterized protein (TIGR03067 family)
MTAMTCPSRDELFDYAVGRLSDEASEGIAEHLESCQTCQAGLATFDDADDTLVARLRQPTEEDPYLGESQCQVALARARSVGRRGGSPTPEGGGGSLSAPESEPPTTHSGLLGTLGEYQLLEKLGHGGMGTVYRAVHTKLDRVVALKVLPKGRSDDQQAIARFEREMKAIGRLDHPNIVRAYDAREIDGKPVLIMEYVEGLDLGKLVRRLGPLPVADACELARQAALGLQYAHQNGLVHRDVKPSNLMLTPEGEVKVLDLGLARFPRADAAGEEMTSTGRVADAEPRVAGVSRSEPPAEQSMPGVEGSSRSEPPARPIPGTRPDEITGTGQAMGTADYMAPEQASDSHAVDIRADVYSLGCTLYKLLSGRAPFSGEKYRGSFEKMTAHVREPVPPIREYRAEIPEELAAVLDRMLAKDPDGRFAAPLEVVEALQPFCIGCDLPALLVRAEEAAEPPSPALPRGVSSAAPAPQPTPLPFWRRGRLLAAAVGLMLLSLGGGIALGIIITIHRHGQTTSVELPEGSSASIDKAGNLSVTPPRESGKPAPSAAKSDFEAIQGTWEVVSGSQNRDNPGLVWPAHPYDRFQQILEGTKVIITKDALKVQGSHVVDITFQYQINPNTKPKIIDVKAANRVGLGVYELQGDRLTICSSGMTQGAPQRPSEVWAEYNSDKELLVLRRVGDAIVEADEKAIQGTWEIVRCEGQPGPMMRALATTFAWPSGESAKGRDVEISRDTVSLKGSPGEVLGVPQETVYCAYAIDPRKQPKTIDLLESAGSAHAGAYELDGDQLKICASYVPFLPSTVFPALPAKFGVDRPKSIPTNPGEGQVLIVMRRVPRHAAAGAAKAKPAPPATKSGAEAIQGTWEVELMVSRGRRVPKEEEAIRGMRVVIQGDRFVILRTWLGQKLSCEYRLRLDPRTSPKRMDWVTLPSPTASWGGLRLGLVVVEGIYELEGDRLRICQDASGGGRPTHFPSAPYGPNDILAVLKYVGPVPEKFPPPPRPGSAAHPDPVPPGVVPAQSSAPTPGRAEPTKPAEVVQIEVAKSGEVRLGGRQVGADASAPWLAGLRQRLASGAVVRVEVQCAPEASYRHVAALTEALQAAGVRHVSICGAESTVRPAVTPAQLNFRIAPTRGGKGKPAIGDAEINRYSQELQDKGAKASRSNGAPYAWFELKGNAENAEGDLITAEYKGARYVLLATTPDDVMLADDQGQRAWKLLSVGLSSFPPGVRNRFVSLRMDRAGEDRLFVLTATHLGQPLAMLLDDQVVSVRSIKSRFNLAEIRGRFDRQEVQSIFFALQAGIFERLSAEAEGPEKPGQSAGQPTEGKAADQPNAKGSN